jgi:SEC-C motif-containing protein
MTTSDLCPCTSNLEFSECCGPLLDRTHDATTPERLMRSRYSAFAKHDIEYIKETMVGEVLDEFDEQEALNWAQNSSWLGLEVIDAPEVTPTSKKGFVEFVANYSINGERQELHEYSSFKKIDDKWFYTGGIVKTDEEPIRVNKVGRNELCPCGSGKKYKKCCVLITTN